MLFHSQLIVYPEDIQEGEIRYNNRRPEREQQQQHRKLEEGEIATSAVTVDAGGAPEDEIRDSEELETCGREAWEKPKKLKKVSKSKSKKWELRPHIQSDIDPPHQHPSQANKSAKHPRRNSERLSWAPESDTSHSDWF
jgi:hypothetical protein